MIPVTKPFLPPIEEYQQYLKILWNSEYLTNHGPFVKDFQDELEDYLGVGNLLYVSNGTIALQIAIKALDLEGDIITTPFSFIATTSSIVWEGCKPIFVDIDPYTLNLDPLKIEEAITSNTTAIIATHVFGNPCDVEAIQEIAERHQLKVIYDGAHAFGTLYKGRSIFNWGDISICSFHATKLYHTVEGGAVITNDDEVALKVTKMRNFGHDGTGNIVGIGINGKNSELHAAMGLCNLNYLNKILAVRRRQFELYAALLDKGPVKLPQVHFHTRYNYAYFPVIFNSEYLCLNVLTELESHEIHPRRYFYPSLNHLDYTNNNEMEISSDISKRILCLPLYHSLKAVEQNRVVELINKVLRETNEEIDDAWWHSFSNTGN